MMSSQNIINIVIGQSSDIAEEITYQCLFWLLCGVIALVIILNFLAIYLKLRKKKNVVRAEKISIPASNADPFRSSQRSGQGESPYVNPDLSGRPISSVNPTEFYKEESEPVFISSTSRINDKKEGDSSD